MKKVIVFGNTILSKMLYYDSLSAGNFEVICFTVDKAYLNQPEFLGRPQVDFDSITSLYPPGEYDMISILGGYSNMRNREKMYTKANMILLLEIIILLAQDAILAETAELRIPVTLDWEQRLLIISPWRRRL